MNNSLKKIALMALAAICAFSTLADAQSRPPANDSTVFKNTSQESIIVYTRGTYPGAQREFLKTLYPGDEHRVGRVYGATTLFFLATSDTKAAEEYRGSYIALMKAERSDENDSRPTTRTVVNQTNEDVNVYRTIVYPGAKPEFVTTLRPGQTYEKSLNIVGSSLSFKLARGGEVREEERQNDHGIYNVLVVVAQPKPDPNPRDSVRYINRTGQRVVVYSKMNGNPAYAQAPTREKTLAPNESYDVSVMPGSPIKSFRLEDGREVEEQRNYRGEIELHASASPYTPKPVLNPNPNFPNRNWSPEPFPIPQMPAFPSIPLTPAFPPMAPMPNGWGG